MKNIQVLDCTLRDGGYCNDWNFGNESIYKIISKLEDTGIDIIECGFLTQKIIYDMDRTKFSELSQVNQFLGGGGKQHEYVVMINYGEYDLADIPNWEDNAIDGIRVAFHKKDYEGAMEFCYGIKNLGYKVFVQPMLTMTYSEEEFNRLLDLSNQIMPYAFYIVDSFGTLKQRDIIEMVSWVDQKLDPSIQLGFHSHNNMQLAYSNAQTFLDKTQNHSVIVDCSVFGMGRGAGNLNEELFVEYLNENEGKKYNVKPLLEIIDDILGVMYQHSPWGYSLPNYLSAAYNTHPNYATFLSEKNSLTYKETEEIFSLMDDDKRYYFDKNYIENLYNNYMNKTRLAIEKIESLRNVLAGKTILLIAPGKSAVLEKSRIINFCRDNEVITISVNYVYNLVPIDYVFVSNLRRVKNVENIESDKIIATSNVNIPEAAFVLEYVNYKNSIEYVEDNSALMLIKFLCECKVKKICLAGLDGYSYNSYDNYVNEKMELVNSEKMIFKMNQGMREAIDKFRKMVEIEFLTNSRYIT